MNKKNYTAMNEAVFYECIGNHEERIKVFLEQVLKEKVLEVKIQNVKLLKDFIETKDKILDYLVLTEKGYINVEINNSNAEWIMKRNVSYAGKILSNSIEKSKNYKEIIPVVQINLVRLGKTEQGICEYVLKSKKQIRGFNEVLTDIIKIYTINIDFYKEMVYNGNKKFIKDNYLLCAIDLTLDEIDKISERNEILMDFKEDLEKINEREDFVKWMSIEEEAEKIKNTYIAEGYEEGLELGKKEGIKEGIKEGKKEGYEKGYEKGEKSRQIQIAKNMINENLDINLIIKVTNLTKEEIEGLV